VEYILCGECAVVHEEKIYVADIIDEEGLVTGGHKMAGFLVGAISNLWFFSSATVS
jgi:hypothetical protein